MSEEDFFVEEFEGASGGGKFKEYWSKWKWHIALMTAIVVVVIVIIVVATSGGDKKQPADGFGSAYEEAYLSPFPQCATTPYSGPQGYGQWFSNGPPNVG